MGSFYCVDKGKKHEKLIGIICYDDHNILKFSQTYYFTVPSSRTYI